MSDLTTPAEPANEARDDGGREMADLPELVDPTEVADRREHARWRVERFVNRRRHLTGSIDPRSR